MACQKAELGSVYGAAGVSLAAGRIAALRARHAELFGEGETRIFSAPGRIELAGNHTDHNRGLVLAAAVSADAICAARPNGTGEIRLWSEGFGEVMRVDTASLAARHDERGTSAGILRGLAAALAGRGVAVRGFDAAVFSDVPTGSGLSSSAAFEVLMATAMDGLFGGGTLAPMERAKAAQFAENEYFGKPSGLMDQAASALGGAVTIDFGPDEPIAEKLDISLEQNGLALVITRTGSAHDDLTAHYASIPADMRAVARALGTQTLREADELAFYAGIPGLRAVVSDRAILRAAHYFAENRRVRSLTAALRAGDMPACLRLTAESGKSSWMLLQNIHTHSECQPMALALMLSERALGGRGATRLSGGGFAGVIMALTPVDAVRGYIDQMEAVFGQGACSVPQLRAAGACEVAV